jgi:glycosyltransferase involved in cell wall biosynthesis
MGYEPISFIQKNWVNLANRECDFVLLKGYYFSSPWIRNLYDYEKTGDRYLILADFLVRGGYNLLIEQPLSRDYLLSQYPAVSTDDGHFTVLMHCIYLLRADYHTHFDLSSPAGRTFYCNFFANHGADEVSRMLAMASNVQGRESALKPGVNLVGFPHKESGLGEDLRMMSDGLKKLKTDYLLLDMDRAVDSASSFGPIKNVTEFSVSVFNIPGNLQLRFLLERGSKSLEHHYNVGYWPWELSRYPQKLAYSYQLVDEIWAISDFVANIYLQSACPVPIRKMPLGVCVKGSQSLTREKFKLPLDAFLFFFHFDFNSNMDRKNPKAVIRAFQNAFTANENTGLVIKVVNHDAESAAWKEFENLVAGNPRIYLIYEMLPRPEMLGLIQLMDCYVSLHRAEGFGRGMAEAMLLGVPVIATGYSGNLEYMDDENSLLVNYELIPLADGQYSFGDSDLQWAHPDENHAAQLMHQIYSDTALREKIRARLPLVEKKVGMNAFYARLANAISALQSTDK